LPPALQRPEIVRAVEELKMLTQTEIERERYEARRKWQLDFNSGMFEAREEGLEQGREEGRKIAASATVGTIQFCERVLKRPETPTEQLTLLPLEELTRLAQELQEQVLKQQQ
jgi:flagellar biosynthesis/type III secretory pathway protein FliH